MRKTICRCLLLAAAVSPALCAAASPDEQMFGYAQYGQWDSARQAALGVLTPWPIHYSGDDWTTFWQAEAAEWFTKKYGQHYVASTEVGLGPVGRYYLTSDHNFFADGLANIAFIAPRYWRDNEREGTVFDFGGGFAVGYRFGEAKSSEISFGAEHFSNGGLREPNPGRNFFQVRYAVAF